MLKNQSLPSIKLPNKLKKVQLRKMNRSVVRRLYRSEVKKIKSRNNSFWHKTKEDSELEKGYDNLRKRKLLPIQQNACFYYNKIDRPEIKNLIKLQNNMRQAISFAFPEEQIKLISRTSKRGLSMTQSEIFLTENETEHPEEFNLSINEHKDQLNFVKTRIKVIMTTLPKLREGLEHWPKGSSQYLGFSKKVEKFVGLLKIYENAELKLKQAIQACENTLEMQKKTPLYL